MEIGQLIKIQAFDGYGRYGSCYWRVIRRYVKEIHDNYIIVNPKADFSGKDLKVNFNSQRYTILEG